MTDCHDFLKILRQRGYRVTPQREMIVEAIAHEGRHMSAEEVFEEVQGRTRAVNIATIYRTLDLLVEEGLASRTDLGGGRVVYATARHGPHVHLVCRCCGRVMDADVAPFRPAFEHIQARYGFACGSRHFAVYGLCSDCQSTGSSLDKAFEEVQV